MNEAATDFLTHDEAMALMGRLLAGVPEERLPLVAAQAVWGMGPWSSRSAVVRAMAAWVAQRLSDDLPPLPRALIMAACGRASIADRRFLAATEECEAAVAEAGRGGDERVVRTCRALFGRALLQNGEVGKGMEALQGLHADGLPPAFEPEVLLALGLADIVRGEPALAAEGFSRAEQVAASIEAPYGSLAQWHRAWARAGRVHAMTRLGQHGDAWPVLASVIEAASANEARREAADLLVLRGALRLAAGEYQPDDFRQSLGEVSCVSGASQGVDFVVGLPADLAGARGPEEAAARLEEAAGERFKVRDRTGFVVSVLASAGFRAVAQDLHASAHVIEVAAQGAQTLQWTEERAMLEIASTALGGQA